MSGEESLLKFINEIITESPEKAIKVIESLSREDAANVIEALPFAVSVKIFDYVQPKIGAIILSRFDPRHVQDVLKKISHEQTANMFRHFSEEKSRQLLEILPPGLYAKLSEILNYPLESAGRLMQPDFIAFRNDMKVKDVIQSLRKFAKKRVPTSYCYVVDYKNNLLGVLNMHDLVLADPSQKVSEIMKKDVLKVSPFADRESLIAIFSEKHYLAIPVVDEDGKLLGIVNTNGLIESTEEEASEDIQILFGASAEERVYSPLFFKVKKRLPWLYINLLTAFAAGAVVALFEDMISRVAVLAVFLPIIAGQGGNAGTQSLSVIIRALVMREIKPNDAWRAIMSETASNTVSGIFIGAVTALIAWLWKGNPVLGVIVGAAMIINMFVAGLAGAFIPLTMKKFGWDPAHSSGIFLTTLTDIVGFFSFLGLAWIFIDKIL